MEAPAVANNIGPDGERIVDMTFYDLLGVSGSADETTLKKAYRKKAILLHPDKNPDDPNAAARFQEVSEAYTVLSDSNLRAVYNKQGKNSTVSGAAEAMPDPGTMFAQLFGGAAFMDWIGEISLGKDLSTAFEMSMTEEEIDVMKSGPDSVVRPQPQSTLHHTSFEDHQAASAVPSSSASSRPASVAHDSVPFKSAPTTSTTLGSATSPPPSVLGTGPASAAASSTSVESAAAAKKAAADKKEQLREKMEQHDKERQEEKRERIKTLVQKLRDRIRPFVEASSPGDAEDPETKKFAERIREESTDLAMESFGIEICHLIGEVYMTKASSYIKLHRKASSNILGIPAWSSRVKEKFSMLKEGWSFLSVGLDVQSAMADMEKRQAKGELDEAEMKTIEADLSGKLLLVAWKGSRFELSSILRTVVDGALSKEDHSVTDATLMNRAKAILLCGAILKSVVPDESDDERRELEKLVAAAAQKRKEKGRSTKKPVPVKA